MNRRTTTNIYAVIVMGFLSLILFTIFENNQHISQIFNLFNSDYFNEVVAGKEDEEEKSEEDSLEQKICNKLFESETCEKVKEDKPIEKEELTEEEIKEEAIINRYLEPGEKKYPQNLGTLTIRIINFDTREPLSNAIFKISPNPFTLNDSLVIHDNNNSVDFNSSNGIIFLDNVKFASYVINETKGPENFVPLLIKNRVTVHETNPNAILTIENKDTKIPFKGKANVSTELNDEALKTFISKGALVNGKKINKVNEMPEGFIQSVEEFRTLSQPKEIVFESPAPVTSTASQLFKSYAIPNYPAPTPEIAVESIYIPPLFFIKQENSNNNFILTPIIGKIFSHMSLLINEAFSTESNTATVERVEMKFAKQATNVGFNFGTSDNIPKNLDLPPLPIDKIALFLNIDYIYSDEPTQMDFSNPESFISSPMSYISINKSLNTDKLIDGCPNVSLYAYNEKNQQWNTLDKLQRYKLFDTEEKCGYVIKFQHFSKFAVGGTQPPVDET
ncbi:MAG TPA: SpaA isopeptide-forming pilin-related protein [Nitrososphaeraceae archaeon]|nr:SpaA isopeptide-forming pilin-related protein [Nitrososphaeraceae archaeon]